MNIIIKCDCGNMVNLNAYPKKYLQLRDNLEQFDFCYEAGN